MYKITRIYAGNFGYRDAWFDGVPLDLHSPFSGEPAHTILKAPNGTGKTSLLGFVFSCFEPQIKRFLPHLNDQSRVFHHYFDPHGMPAIALVEFLLPRHTGQEGKRLVIGQMCAMHAGQPNRTFFSFEEVEGLSFDRVPAPKLRGDGRVVRTADEFARWVHEMRSKYPGNFAAFESQTKWQEHLDRERGLDPYLFRVQLELSRREGAVDEGFLRFGSETDFLKKFFEMVLSEDRGMKVRDAVALACQKLKDYPQYERRLAALAKLSNEITPFAREADALADATSQAAKLTGRAACTVASLDVVKERFESAQRQEEHLANTKMKEAEQRGKAAEAAAAVVETLQAEKLQRQSQRAREEETAALDARTAADRGIQYVDAAQLLQRIEEAKDRAVTITRQIAQAEQGLIDFEREARDAGAVLRYALKLAEDEARTGGARHKAKAEASSREVSRLEKEAEGLQGEKVELERRRGALEQVQAQYEQGLSDFWKDGMVDRMTGERVAPAIRRHNQAVEAARADRVRFEQEAQSRRNHAQQLAMDVANVQGRLGELREQQRVRDSLYNGGVAKRDELSELAVLCQAAGGADRVDPESATTALALKGFIARLAVDIARLNVRRAELEEDEKSLEASELASAGADVETVVESLRSAGIASARPFAHYIAKVEPDVSRARAMVLSNPARYLGVAVASLEDLSNAQDVLEQPPNVSRPVVISLNNDRPDTPAPSQVVVPPASDSTYNFEAADRLAKRLREEGTQLVTKMQELARLQGEAHRAEQSLADFLAHYGDGKLAALKAEIERITGDINAARVQLESLNAQRAKAVKNAERLEGLARQKGEETERLGIWLAQLVPFERQFEATENGRRAEIAAVSRSLATNDTKRRANASDLERARSDVTTEEKRAADLFSEGERRAAERARVDLYHDNIHQAEQIYASDSQPLGVYDRRYEQAKRTYDTEVEKRVGTLKTDLHHANEARKRDEDDYRDKFPQEADFLLEAKCLIGVDYKTERANRKTIAARCATTYTEASNRRAVAESAEAEHRNKRKYPSERLDGASEITDAALEEKLAAKAAVREKAAQDARLASQAGEQAKGRANTNAQRASQVGSARNALVGLLAEGDVGKPDESLLEKADGLAEEVPSLVQQLTGARRRVTDADTRCRQAYDRVQKVVRSEEFEDALPTLAGQLSQNSFEKACADRAGLLNGVAQQIAATTSARNAVRADFDACLSELEGFSNEALDALKAATRKRLPDSVPHYGGREVLIMKNVISTMTAELRRGMLERYLKNLIDDNRIPQDGAHLAAEAVATLHGGQPLGLKLIRVTQHARLEYDEISKIASSGGEKVTAAMLLYFVVVKLRAENRARRADGGPLILDNPFAKMNLESLWRTVRSLADSVGVQCIFATILEDKNALSVFDRLIELRPGPVNRRTERRHVEAVDVTFRPAVAA
jgi:hypothetical protein